MLVGKGLPRKLSMLSQLQLVVQHLTVNNSAPQLHV